MNQLKPLNYIKIINLTTEEEVELEVGSFDLLVDDDTFIDLSVKSVSDNKKFDLSFPDFRENPVELSLYINHKMKFKLTDIILKTMFLGLEEFKFTFVKR